MEPITAVSTQMRDLAQAITVSDIRATEAVRHLVHEMCQPLSVMESAAFLSQMILDQAEPRVHDQLEKIQAAVLELNVMLCDLALGQQAERHGEPLSLAHLVDDAMRERTASDNDLVSWVSPPATVIVRLPPAQAVLLARHALGVLAYLGGNRNAVRVALRQEERTAVLECRVNLLVQARTMPAEVTASLGAVKRIAESNGGGARIDSGDGCGVTLRVALPAC